MPGVTQLSVDQIVLEAQELNELGIPAVVLFGIPATKDATGSENYSDEGIVQQAIRAIKATLPELIVIADLCLCEYTDHGHCGIVTGDQIDNDATLDILQRAAPTYARAGADLIAPSGMMDGMVSAIRSELDSQGYENVGILSYAVKYASAFYGPFREAAEGAPKFGDRKTHQMDPANSREALRELALDIDEGADLVDDRGDVGVVHHGDRRAIAVLQDGVFLEGAEDLIQLLESTLSPDDKAAKVTTRSKLEQVQAGHRAKLNTGDVAEGAGDALVVVEDDQRAAALHIAAIAHLALAGADRDRLLNLLNLTTKLLLNNAIVVN